MSTTATQAEVEVTPARAIPPAALDVAPVECDADGWPVGERPVYGEEADHGE